MHHQMSGGATTYHVSSATLKSIALIAAVGIALQIFAPHVVDTLRAYWLPVGIVALVLSVAHQYYQLKLAADQQNSGDGMPKMFVPIPFTLEDLRWYDGERNTTSARMKRGDTAPEEYSQYTPEYLTKAVSTSTKLKHPLPIYDNLVFLSVKGVVYNVSPDYYGPGAGYSVFSAKDSSRQLGKVKVAETECNADWTTLNEKHTKVLADWEMRYRDKYSIVGWVVPDDKYFERGESLPVE